MKRVIFWIALVLSCAVSGYAVADSPNNPPGSQNSNANSNSNSNSAQGGQGGQGGNGGNGGQGGGGGNANNATTVTNSQSQHQKQSQSQAAVAVGIGGSQSQTNAGNTQSVSVDTPRQAPAVIGAALAAAPETCMGSASVGASTPFGGVAVGSTYKSEDCERRMYARALAGLGLTDAALAVLAESPMVKAALSKTGFQAKWFTADVLRQSVAAASQTTDFALERNP